MSPTPDINDYPNPASGRYLGEDSKARNITPNGIKDILTGTVDTTGKALDAVDCSMVRIYNVDPSITIYWGKAGKIIVPISPLTDSGWIPIQNANLVSIKSASGTPSYVVPCL